MSQLGPIGVGLSVVFALFMAVLFAELFYVWRCRQRRLQLQHISAVRTRGSSTGITGWQCAKAMMQRILVRCRWSAWREVVCAGWKLQVAVAKGSPPKSSWMTFLRWRRPPAETQTEWPAAMEEEGKVVKQQYGVKQEEQEEDERGEEEEDDLLKMVGLWGPPRLLFTIMEETKEEMEALEEVQQQQQQPCRGRGSRGGSRASSELLFVATSSSCCSSPFVTPPSSPPFSTPFGSPAPASVVPPIGGRFLCSKPVEVDSTSSSSTSSSSPLLAGGRLPLSAHFEDSSSLSSSLTSSSAPTPPALSPYATILPPSSSSSSSCCSTTSTSSPCCKQRHRHPLGLLLDPPPSPVSSLHQCQNRVYPLNNNTLGCGSNAHGKLPSLVPPSKLPEEPPSPSPQFLIPAPSQPTTPCAFRPSLHAKKAAATYNDFVASSIAF